MKTLPSFIHRVMWHLFMEGKIEKSVRQAGSAISFFKDFIYLFMRDTERERQRHRQRETQAPSRKPNVGLNPGTPGSHPKPKADAQLLRHPYQRFLFFSYQRFYLKCCPSKAHVITV